MAHPIKDRQADAEIEVTPEMMKAGAIMLDLRRPDICLVGGDDERLVRDIFLAMARVSAV